MANPVPLSSLKPGDAATIAYFTLSPEIRQRLLELGLTEGTSCEIRRFAPLGDPLEIRVRNYNLSLRKAEADGILVIPAQVH
jgi:Fe2+ transport system protein FeoA